MNESEVQSLLLITRDIAKQVIALLKDIPEIKSEKYTYLTDFPREMKTNVDNFLDKEITTRLSHLGVPILSEESGRVDLNSNSPFQFIIDPLDGTVNYVHDISQSSISIALYEDEKPIFGVLAIYPSEEIVWGGKKFGAFIGESPISVSDNADISKSILCTGFPSRFDFSNNSLSNYFNFLRNFGKIRMLGAASISLFNVAKGSADCYFEKEIMIWDVAAGIAVLEGAGGEVSVSPGRFNNSLDVVASNGAIKINHIEDL
jgi:myo-inositol-1(or 4)-monophosphatase